MCNICTLLFSPWFQIGEPTTTKLGWWVRLNKLETPLRYSHSADTLELEVEIQTDDRLHFKVGQGHDGARGKTPWRATVK